MTLLRTISSAAVMTVFSAIAFAQAKGAAPAPTTPGASAPMVTPSGMTPPRPTPANTPGLTMMTPQEREQHRQDLERAKTGDECRAVVAKQREQMAQRAKERGQPSPNNVGADPCAGR